MPYSFQKATLPQTPAIWAILEHAIQRRKADGSEQWQNGYPNLGSVKEDVEQGVGFVLMEDNTVIGYCAALVNDEPAYDHIEGAWLTTGDFIVVHRVAIAPGQLGKGLSGKLMEFVESYAIEQGIYSIKVDTNFDNLAMIKIFERAGYVYCGEVILKGAPRRAYEKVLRST